jgi:hypothetical protein
MSTSKSKSNGAVKKNRCQHFTANLYFPIEKELNIK